MTQRDILQVKTALSRFPIVNSEAHEATIRKIVQNTGAIFIGIQHHCAEVIGEDLALITHPRLPQASIAIRLSQIDEFQILLATSAQYLRYNPKPVLEVMRHD